MATMTAEERQREIVRAARRTGSVDVASLAAELGVAKETVRRDLRTLEDHGLMRRTHGGAYPVESAGFETTLAFRTTSHVPEKRRIAAAAAELLGDAETVFVDEGFTPQLIAEALPRDRAADRGHPPPSPRRARSPRPTTPAFCCSAAGSAPARWRPWTTGRRRCSPDSSSTLAFIGANGISREHGLTTPDPAVSEVKAQAIRGSRRAVFAGVHTKFGMVSFCRFADISSLEAIVTSTLLPASEAHRYSLQGLQVIRV